MAQAKLGDTIKIHYTGTLTDGTPFDSSHGRDPLEIELGAGNVIPGFEAAVVGMSPGDTKTVTVTEDEAYGPRHEEAVQEFPRSAIPENIDLEIGLQLQAQGPNGKPMILTVTSLGEETVTLDPNHPLAGRDLVFELELVEIA